MPCSGLGEESSLTRARATRKITRRAENKFGAPENAKRLRSLFAKGRKMREHIVDVHHIGVFIMKVEQIYLVAQH